MHLITINDNAIVPLLVIAGAFLLLIALLVYAILLTVINVIRKGREKKRLNWWQGILLYVICVFIIFGLLAMFFTVGGKGIL